MAPSKNPTAKRGIRALLRRFSKAEREQRKHDEAVQNTRRAMQHDEVLEMTGGTALRVCFVPEYRPGGSRK